MLSGAFGTARRKHGSTFQGIWQFCCVSPLRVTPAFKMRFWNIGAEGQTLDRLPCDDGCV